MTAIKTMLSVLLKQSSGNKGMNQFQKTLINFAMWSYL